MRFHLLLLLLLLSGVAHGQVLPNDAMVEGKTIGEWTAECWKWIGSISTNENPILDCNGRWANNRQPDETVLFIAPINGITQPPCVRTFTVPEDKLILLPVLGIAIDNVDVFPPWTLDQMHDALNSVLDEPAELRAFVDGVAVPDLLSHRTTSPPFSVDLTNADNPTSLFYGHPVTGLVDPIIADGYWLMLEPLSVGPHVLHTGGQTSIPLFVPHELICNITVVGVPLPERVQRLIDSVRSAKLGPNRIQPLLASLNTANSSFGRNDGHAAINQLRAFQNKVRAQVAASDAALAHQLSTAAQRIIDKAAAQLQAK